MATIPISQQVKQSVIEFDSIRPANSMRAPHPLQTVHHQILHKQQTELKERLCKMYGAHAAFRQDMDEFVLRKCRPGPVRKETPFGLDVLLGRDGNIDQFDYLGGVDPMTKDTNYKRFDE
mmetsp:Transcript_22925/g.36807  ORF Transcript_22925/g.36807 Transcript_22925/m.36807 type:complete len:120 (+) Transcript_22925:74-433(+)|eukprot:CAMPEP_0202686784 /NCGR_PEP_ID=MMETSP1385-20130828/2551_1 /ASSEMBLY_ACC=CAM_ASM_000861 /TAXON_ID=933848 /ORGANISM="Elphidium margaritaceum" /LENGTH=119 /DNA_ID=CAMNT_0049341437 /DNA_START=74 /DNA_END=433 /DNA_ORIENTATION=+